MINVIKICLFICITASNFIGAVEESPYVHYSRYGLNKRPLEEAIAKGNLQEIRDILLKPHLYNEFDDQNPEGYLLAAMSDKNKYGKLDESKAGQIFVLMQSHEKPIDINKLIKLAADSGIYEGVKLAYKYKANLNCKEYWTGNTPLISAILGWNIANIEKPEYLKIIEYLIESGADLNLQNNQGNTALIQAAKGNKMHIVNLLLKNGADITIFNNENKTFFDYLIAHAKLSFLYDFIYYILNAEYVEEIKGAQSALLMAAYLNDAYKINALLRKGVWFKSEKYELYFNNLIADKPRIHAVIERYKVDRFRKILGDHENPRMANVTAQIVAEY